MSYVKNGLFNTVLEFVPISHFFKFKLFVAQLCGIIVSPSVRLSKSIKIYGGGEIRIGDGSWIGLNTNFYIPEASQIEIGCNCDVAPNVIFQLGSHVVGDSTRRAGAGVAGKIRIGDGVWVGVGAIILPDVDIGSGTVIAAGSVVKSGNYPPNCLIAGVPAKFVKYLPSD